MIFNRSSQFICFTDSVEVVGRMFQMVTKQYIRLKFEAADVGIKVNA